MGSGSPSRASGAASPSCASSSSNNLKDFGLKKSLDNLEAVREKFQAITNRFASFQAQWLNVHVDFPLLQRLGIA